MAPIQSLKQGIKSNILQVEIEVGLVVVFRLLWVLIGVKSAAPGSLFTFRITEEENFARSTTKTKEMKSFNLFSA